MDRTCTKEFSIEIAASGSTAYAYWKLEEGTGLFTPLHNEVDSFDLDVFGASTKSIAGKIGNAMRCGTPSGHSFRNGPNSHWDFSGQSFTIRMWVYMPTYSGNRTLMDTTSSFSLERDGGFVGDPGFLIWIVWCNVDTPTVQANVVPGTWQRVIVWHEHGVGIGIKIDNDAAVTSPTADTMVAGNQRLIFSSSSLEPQYILDEVAVWNRKLSDAEMLSDWNSGAGKTYPDCP